MRADAKPVSALPPVKARALAFVAILLCGVAGGAIGASFVSIQCHGDCTAEIGAGGVAGGAAAATGTAIVATLTLRAMGEWKRIEEERNAGGDDRPAGGR